MSQRGRFDAEDFQPRPDAGEHNGGLPAPHEQPRRAFGRGCDKHVHQRVHFSPPFWTFWVWLPPFCLKQEGRPPGTGSLPYHFVIAPLFLFRRSRLACYSHEKSIPSILLLV